MEDIQEKERAKRLIAFFNTLDKEKNFFPVKMVLQYKLLVLQKYQGEIVGVSGVRPTNTLFLRIIPKNLLFLFVKSDHQNRGIGQKLARKVIRKAIRRNYSYIALYVKNSNSKAIHIYTKLGFRRVYSPFTDRTDKTYFMMIPLKPMGWVYILFAFIYSLFAPLKGLYKKNFATAV